MAQKFTGGQLRKKLTSLQYKVLREKGTETPFTGEFLDKHDDGTYTCKVCGTKLFSSDTKFESGSGWPSFYNVITSDVVKLTEDCSGGMQRVEATCANCGSHLGHVFHDAPQPPTGVRFCINSASLDFLPKKSKNKK